MGNITILLVEDESIEAMDIKRTLESFGYQVPDVASSGQEAINKALELRPDIILMDIVLKGEIDGIEAISKIKELNIPFIYLTAHSEESTIERAKFTEPAGYIIKPYDSTELKYAIELAIYKNQMETELKESEKYYRTIFEHTGTATVILEEDSTISLANAEFEKLSGYSKKELEGKKSWTVFVKEEYLEKMKEYHRLRRTDPQAAPEIYDFEFTDRQGNVKNIHLTVDIIPGTNKSVASLLDITDRQKSAKRLKKSVLRFRALAEYSVDGIITTNVNGRILYFNNSLLKMFGYTPDELQNSPLTTLMPERYREKFLESLKKFQDTGEHRLAGRTIETFGLKKNGKEFIFEMSLTKWETGQETYFTSIIRDITERKKSFKALKESEEKFKSLVDNAADILLVHDFDGKVVEVNKSAAESLGYSQEELLQMNIMDIEQDTDLKSVQEHVWPKIKPDKPFSLLGHLRRKNGSIFPVEVKFAVLDIHDQRLFMGLARDITEQLKLENSLKESETKYRSLFESNPDYTILVGLDGIILDFNEAAEQIIGMKKEEGVGKHFSELSFFPKEEINLHVEKFSRLLKHKKVSPYESRIIAKNGDTRWLETAVTLIWNDTTPIYILIINSDITKRKKVENEIIESLQEKEVLLREIHHRVKNNMQIISSLLNLQIQHVNDGEAENVLKESQGRVKSMAMIHEKLYQSDSFSKINFKSYVERLVWDIFFSYGIKAHSIEPVLDIEDIKIGIDTAIPLGLIINELVTNSVKYAFSEYEGTIKIEFKSSADELELIVADDGIGLPKDFNFENTKTLGLQLVNSLVKQIDGKIKLVISKGTEFKITFKELKYKERI